MNTQEIMALSLKMAGFKAIPADSAIYHPGSNRDSVGINLFITELEKRGLEVTRASGVIEP